MIKFTDVLCKQPWQRIIFGMVEYLPSILTNIEIVSFANHIFINYCTEDAYHFNIGFGHHCSFAVYSWRHLNDPIPVILETNEKIVFFSLYFAFKKIEHMSAQVRFQHIFSFIQVYTSY